MEVFGLDMRGLKSIVCWSCHLQTISINYHKQIFVLHTHTRTHYTHTLTHR